MTLPIKIVKEYRKQAFMLETTLRVTLIYYTVIWKSSINFVFFYYVNHYVNCYKLYCWKVMRNTQCKRIMQTANFLMENKEIDKRLHFTPVSKQWFSYENKNSPCKSKFSSRVWIFSGFWHMQNHLWTMIQMIIYMNGFQ